MATIDHSHVSKTYVTITKAEAEWLSAQTSNYSGGLNINVWQQHGHNRLYIQLSGKKDKVFFDLNAEILEAGMSLALAKALVAFIESQMPAEEISETIQYAVISSDLMTDVVEELETESQRYHAHFQQKAEALGMTGTELEIIWIRWRDAIIAPIAQSYNPDRPHFGWAHIQNSLGMWDMFFQYVDNGQLANLPQSLSYNGGEPQIVW